MSELEALPWDQSSKSAFLNQQFAAQHNYYQAHFPHADFQVIESAGTPIGRAYLLWSDIHLQIIDISLIPSYRGQGLGSQLLAQWLARADAQGLDTGLYVESYNPAQNLYRRMGFEVTGADGVYFKMLRPANQANTP
ncbi:GNAT family N-acetyltransferase [Salinicola sp. DM10]|uniref:GNAT family N-acetyltransferase n=1 Tax=Salinicola sp. DM10 TaxID=2815721 RepID=UPI001A909BBB|nr:GNAT family N-acetyltransferase [Salinicola sp. DM10]MCE3025390.1 GNAT family N-acetyltransferase [Salinicola sp. DM10]